MTPESIRSAQVVDTFYPVIDGVVHTVHSYAEIMNRISYSCVICPAAKGGYDDSTLPYDVIRSAALRFPFSDYSVAWPVNPSCAKKIKNIPKLDIIHFHSPFTQRDSGVAAAKALGLPMVATFHTKYYDDIYQATKIHLIAKIVTDSVVSFYNTLDSVWACSETTAETLRSYGFKKEIFVMPNGTNISVPKDPDRLKKTAAESFNIDQNKNNLLFVGTPSWQKNLKLILDSFRLLCDRNGNSFNLIITGSGDELKHVKAYAKKIGLTNDLVNFTGQVEDSNLLAGVFLNGDILFFPSLYDNAPLVLREAAALCVPALLVEGSNSAEVVVPDENGFVAKDTPEDMSLKIEQIFKDKTILRSVGKKASETIPVSWESLIPTVYEKYAEIIEKKKFKS